MKDADDDIVDAIFRRLVTLTPGFTEAIIRQVESEVRQQYGGQRVYVAKRTNTRRLTRDDLERIYRDGISMKPTDEICEEHQISRSTLYRHLKKKARNG